MTSTLRKSCIRSVYLALFLALGANGGEISVTPTHEHELTQEMGLAGPDKTFGIESSVTLGSISLGDEFQALDGRILRARVVTILPGGVIAIHQHDSRPGIAYILEGELTETRNDQSAPVLRRAGTASFEKSGVVHWWVNSGTKKAKALVVDIVQEDTE